MTIPRATYRLQFHRGFTFADAIGVLPYLAALGISHVYASPYLKARAGSMHGYDIVDHDTINPEIGSPAEFEAFIAALHRHGLRQLLDIVPNHMAVMGSDNRWWLDVLENGRSSRHADYFDINWESSSEELRGKVLVPVLAQQYGTVLERGELQVAFDAGAGEFSLWYFDNRFPLDPREYHRVLDLASANGDDPTAAATLAPLLAAFAILPSAHRAGPDGRAARAARAAALKQMLAASCAAHPAVVEFIERRLSVLNGDPARPASFDTLHALIKAQSFRLAFWRVAADDINYRRFFDVNSLAALRMENPAAFDDTHRLILRLVAQGKVDALRVDHPDGLFDPVAYFEHLQQAAAQVRRDVPLVDETAHRALPIYLVIEKILAPDESLPLHWPVHGTTGYAFAAHVNGLFVDRDGEAPMSRIYRAFSGERTSYDDVRRDAKLAVMHNALSSELSVLAALLDRIAKSDRHTCDFTFNSLRRALADVVACFPVYRTYIPPEGPSAAERRFIEQAVAAAARFNAGDRGVHEFIGTVLATPGSSVGTRAGLFQRFIGRFQQLTGPVMAKGMEDTSFYVYDRLVSLNDVGSDPRAFGISVEDFHADALHRAAHWPHAMLAASTHDSKRSEDVRARINVLSEMPQDWRLALQRWRGINRRHKRQLDGVLAPSSNDEYLFYQTLIGTWPAAFHDDASHDRYSARIRQYMQKAAREAKVHTSWLNPDEAYERALDDFVVRTLSAAGSDAFLDDFLTLHRRIARCGSYNGLSQTLLRLTAPGVPDIYQGNELWEFNLVDPDNRQPVDFERRAQMLQALAQAFPHGRTPDRRNVRMLLDTLPDGRAKLYLIWRALRMRADRPVLFEIGDYRPLHVIGERAGHVCAFARIHGDDAAVIVAPRLFTRLCDDENVLPLGNRAWRDTAIVAPDAAKNRWVNVLTGEQVPMQRHGGFNTFALADVLDAFPVALLAA
jgi:malto-oligosyltrehalose synthase